MFIPSEALCASVTATAESAPRLARRSALRRPSSPHPPNAGGVPPAEAHLALEAKESVAPLELDAVAPEGGEERSRSGKTESGQATCSEDGVK